MVAKTTQVNALRSVILAACAVLAAAHSASGQDTPNSRWTLMGLEEVALFVSPIDPAVSYDWAVDEVEFQATVKLREAGLWLVERGVDDPATGRPSSAFLWITVVPEALPGQPDYSVNVTLRLMQPVRLTRDVMDMCGRRPYRYCDQALSAGETAFVATWSAETTRLLGLLEFHELSEVATSLVDRFVVAYRAANST